jgi:methyl-accepting chemotaxis protein
VHLGPENRTSARKSAAAALNAAVEAGAAFAVVADEVRNLAVRCAEAAKTIAGSIEGSAESTRAGKIRLDEVALSVRELAVSALKVKQLVAEVHQDTQGQSSGIHQISIAL